MENTSHQEILSLDVFITEFDLITNKELYRIGSLIIDRFEVENVLVNWCKQKRDLHIRFPRLQMFSVTLLTLFGLKAGFLDTRKPGVRISPWNTLEIQTLKSNHFYIYIIFFI